MLHVALASVWCLPVGLACAQCTVHGARPCRLVTLQAQFLLWVYGSQLLAAGGNTGVLFAWCTTNACDYMVGCDWAGCGHTVYIAQTNKKE
jgi:hypothetical protein